MMRMSPRGVQETGGSDWSDSLAMRRVVVKVLKNGRGDFTFDNMEGWRLETRCLIIHSRFLRESLVVPSFGQVTN